MRHGRGGAVAGGAGAHVLQPEGGLPVAIEVEEVGEEAEGGDGAGDGGGEPAQAGGGEEEDDERKAELDSLRSGRHDPARRAVKEAEACWAVVLLSLLENRSGSLGTKRALTKYPLQRE